MSHTPSYNTRQIALKALHHILYKHTPLEAALASLPDTKRMEVRDRAHALLLIKTTLRRYGIIDKFIQTHLQKPLPVNAKKVELALALGIVQLWYLDTPAHAAVNETVDAAKREGLSRYAGLINAVLKKAAAISAHEVSDQFSNLPAWLQESLEHAYGSETAHIIAHVHSTEPPLDITVKSDVAMWAERLGGTILTPYTVRIENAGSIAQLEGFSEGHWWVQDVAATIPVLMLGNVEGKHVIDLCAAPGGKTAQLIAGGAQVTAIEKSSQRLHTLEENLARLHFSAQTICADALHYTPSFTPDAILLDAPCSATGIIRRHPDIPFHRMPEDVVRLAEIQKKLLHHALDYLKPGGNLVYSVCSLQPEEGEEQIASLLASRSDVSLVPPHLKLDIIQEKHIKNNQLRTTPAILHAEGSMDGFYAVLLEKTKSN